MLLQNTSTEKTMQVDSQIWYCLEVYGEKERREGEQLNRIQAQITGAQQQEVAARANQASAISGGLSAVGDIAMASDGFSG